MWPLINITSNSPMSSLNSRSTILESILFQTRTQKFFPLDMISSMKLAQFPKILYYILPYYEIFTEILLLKRAKHQPRHIITLYIQSNSFSKDCVSFPEKSKYNHKLNPPTVDPTVNKHVHRLYDDGSYKDSLVRLLSVFILSSFSFLLFSIFSFCFFSTVQRSYIQFID